jgi:hypothetical protein
LTSYRNKKASKVAEPDFVLVVGGLEEQDVLSLCNSKKEKKEQQEANEDANEFVLLKRMMNEH